MGVDFILKEKKENIIVRLRVACFIVFWFRVFVFVLVIRICIWLGLVGYCVYLVESSGYILYFFKGVDA